MRFHETDLVFYVKSSSFPNAINIPDPILRPLNQTQLWWPLTTVCPADPASNCY